MEINKQNLPAKTQLPQKTQPRTLTDESMFDLEELKDEELFGIVGGITLSSQVRGNVAFEGEIDLSELGPSY